MKDGELVRQWAIAVALLLAAACERGQQPAPGGGDGAPVSGGTLVIAGQHDLDYANSLVAQESYTQEINRFLLFLPLLRYNVESGYEPYLARSWELMGDTLAVFRLRDDVFWHDGVRTTASDVAFTYQRVKDPATAFANASFFEDWGAVEVVDSLTVRFRFRPHADPLAGWPLLPIVPRHLLESIPPAQMRQAQFNKSPVGNGPFRFVSYQANDRWVFEANPDFPAELGGRPYLDRVVWRVVPESPAQVTEIQTGGADLSLTPSIELARAADPDPQVRLLIRPTRRYAFIGWNGKRPPLGDARVRRALSMAMDRKKILESLRHGYGDLAIGPIPPYHWAYARELEPLPFDTAAARALLVEAGVTDRDGDGLLEDPAGKDFALTLKVPAGNDFNRNTAELIRADLARLGIKVTTRPTELNTLIADISSPERRFDAVLLGFESDPRVNVRDLFHSSALSGPFQLSSYRNPEVDRILDQAGRLTDREAARPLWQRFQHIMLEEQPWTFLYYYPEIHLIRERVRGVQMDIRGAFVTLPRWWITEQPPQAAQPRSGGDE
ncbi:MAG: hypothetical protein HY703_07360 [Gemmatimonadetes bacterium]|nr:hypothetical protein [Gemmatimonadota bacterium]